MYQRWADLLFVHWKVEADALRSLLPPGLTLDTFEGAAYVGLVPFTMTGVRPVGTPSFPPLSNFHEINVRTYVHYQGRDPGVWFFSLDAANSLAVKIARHWFRLPYFRAAMRLQASEQEGERTVVYQTERLWPEPTPACADLRYTAFGPVTPSQPETLEYFLAERYLLYAYANGRLYSGQVHHTPYPLQSVRLDSLSENLIAASGIARPETIDNLLYAREVRVNIYGLRHVSG